MNRKIWLARVFTPLAIIALNLNIQGQSSSQGEESEASSSNQRITGRVVSDGQPVTGATVNVSRWPAGARGRMVSTDGSGAFQVTGLGSGLFVVSAHAPAYVMHPKDPDSLQDFYRRGDSVTINMIKGGVITGKVLNAVGEAVVAITLRATLIGDENGKPTRSGFQRGGSSDDRGVYRLYGLLPGTYVISAGGSFGGYEEGAYDIDAPTYAPSSTRDTAAEISVHSGEEVRGIDIRYRTYTAHTVSGIVQGVMAPNSRSLRVSLTRVRNGITEESLYAYQGPGNKGFEFYGVADGEYNLWAADSTPSGENALLEPRRIIVKGADISGVQLTLRPLASLAGQIVLNDSKDDGCKGKRRPLFEETLVVLEPNRQHQKGQPQPSNYLNIGSPDKAGNFILRNLRPGQYTVSVRFLAKHWFLQTMTLPSALTSNVVDASTAPAQSLNAGRNWITVRSGDRIAGLKITLDEGGATLKGNVEPANNELLPPGLYVHLVPAELDKTDDVLRFVSAPVGGDGGFTLSNLPPGRYFVMTRVTLAAESEALSRLRHPDAGETRARLRAEAESGKIEIEFKPCENITDYQVKIKRAK